MLFVFLCYLKVTKAGNLTLVFIENQWVRLHFLDLSIVKLPEKLQSSPKLLERNQKIGSICNTVSKKMEKNVFPLAPCTMLVKFVTRASGAKMHRSCPSNIEIWVRTASE